jgi:putative acetyltransferase
MNPQEWSILKSLDTVLQSNVVRANIVPIVNRVAQKLAQDHAAVMAWEPIPLSIYGDSLPPFVRSSWVFIVRSRAMTGPERHPNSHQRMMSFRGMGDLQTGGEGNWRSHPLVSTRDVDLEQRWVSIPVNVWHRAVVPDANWVVVSFHTVRAEELIEERPDEADTGRTRQRRYLKPGNTQAETTASSGVVTPMSDIITPERPDSADAIMLITELEAYLELLYPRQSRHGYSVEKLIAQEVAFFVLRVNDTPAGCGGVQLFGAEYGEIKRMYVRPQFRGLGFGKLLLDHLADYARAHEVDLLRLETGVHQPAAIRLYERMGFRRISPFGDYVEDRLCLYYEKCIKG